jgi:hypothetical protein
MQVNGAVLIFRRGSGRIQGKKSDIVGINKHLRGSAAEEYVGNTTDVAE